MRLFQITSSQFTGTAEIAYDEAGIITHINMQHTSMDAATRQRFKIAVPPVIAQIERGGHALQSCTITEVGYVVTLDMFKHEYPYKRNTHLLPPIWGKLSTAQQVQAWQAAIEYRKYCERNAQWYKPMIAATWLTQKEFLNNWSAL